MANYDPRRKPAAPRPFAMSEPPQVEQEADPSSMIATLDRATIDLQIATAKRYPRSVTAFQHELLALATADETIAKSMFYRLPRDGKTIEGPTIRMAEIAGSSWGNLRYGARIVEEGDRFITAQGMCFDLEKNIAIGVEVRRRITNRSGQRYSDDMIQTTGGAAMSIALRNAIFRVVPGALIRPVLEEAKKVSLGKSLTMEQRRERVFHALGKYDATERDVLYVLKRRGAADLTVDDLIALQGFCNAIDDGETSWAEILANAKAAEPENAGELMPEEMPQPAGKLNLRPDPQHEPRQQETDESGSASGADGGSEAGAEITEQQCAEAFKRCPRPMPERQQAIRMALRWKSDEWSSYNVLSNDERYKWVMSLRSLLNTQEVAAFDQAVGL